VTLSLEECIAQELSDPEFAAAYHELDSVSQVARQIIELRSRHEITQRALAEKIGTKQSSISRLESLASSPSLSFLQRIADALEADLKIEFVPRNA